MTAWENVSVVWENNGERSEKVKGMRCAPPRKRKKKMENKKEKPAVTRAEKTDAAKKLIRSLLEKSSFKSNDLIDEGAKLYAQQFYGEETPNSVKGRIGSVIDVMKKEGEIVSEGGTYALKKEETAEKPKKTPRTKSKKTVEEKSENVETVEKTPTKKEDESKKKRAVKKTKGAKVEREEQAEEKQPLPPAPLQPIAPVMPVTPEIAPDPMPSESTEERPKKRGRKPKSEGEERTKAQPPAVKEEKAEKDEKAEEERTPLPAADKKAEENPKQAELKNNVVDMSFLLGGKTVKKELPKREEPKRIAQQAESLTPQTKAEEKPIEKKDEKPQSQKTAQTQKTVVKPLKKERVTVRKPARALTADEKLKDAFLKRLHKLGGDYFEYYSVYLLEKYSRMNGRRLESLKITGGERDGGIDGEIELTDKLGFRETIYIQAKNWDPDKGDERLWVVGETLLQQFIGACVCRQAKEGKQHCRGIFITTSRFTAEAKKILDDTSDKFVGYDGSDLYETAKECAFGLVKKNGEWALDEELLSGEKAFYNMR